MITLGITLFFLLKDQGTDETTLGENEAKAGQGYRIYPLAHSVAFRCAPAVYVGIEFGLGSWITNYMTITTSVALEYGALATSAFWGALALGRLAGAAASRRLSRMQLMIAATASSLAGAIGMLLASGSIWPSVICIAWMSFPSEPSIPPRSPTPSSVFPKEQGKAVGFLVALGNIGGISLPWLAGILLVNSSGLAYGGFITLLILVMLGILFVLQKALRSRSSPAQ